MRSITRIVPAALLATAPLLLMPVAANAQDAHPACEATLMPAEIAAGQAAVQVDVQLASDIGGVTGLEAPEGSGVMVATGEELAQLRVEMALPGEEGQKDEPIRMSEDGRTATLWLTTANAQPGTYEIKLKGEGDHACTAKVTVKPEAEESGY